MTVSVIDSVNKTKILVFEHRKSTTPAFLYGDKNIEQADEFEYLGMLMHGIKGLSLDIDLLCKAARRLWGYVWLCLDCNADVNT